MPVPFSFLVSRFSHSTCSGISHHRTSDNSTVGWERGLEPKSCDLFSCVSLRVDADRRHAHRCGKSRMLAKVCEVSYF